jgi:hypothetical protein
VLARLLLERHDGQKGAIKYNAAWKAVVEGGWKLKTAADDVYVFEKCR